MQQALRALDTLSSHDVYGMDTARMIDSAARRAGAYPESLLSTAHPLTGDGTTDS